jgi:hypothetical protein
MAMCVFWLGVGLSHAERDQYGTHPVTPDMPDTSSMKRMALTLPPAAKEGLKLTMREHLEALDAIVGALGREDFDKAATLAHQELGLPKHHVAMQREEGAVFPSAYHELAMKHHEAAEDLSAVILTKDLKQILPQLQQTIYACVKCHKIFRVKD